jgi:hypothetical protein
VLTNRQCQQIPALFDLVKDLSDRLDQLHRKRAADQAEVGRMRAEQEHARRP